MIGNQQSFSFDDEFGKDNEFLKPVVNENPFHEKDEEIIWDTKSSLASDLQQPSSFGLQITDEGMEIDDHKKVAAPFPQAVLLPKSAPAHQYDGLHTDFSPLYQSTSGLLGYNIAIYDESDSADDHEEEVEFLSQKSPKHSQVEEGVVLNEAYISNPLDQVLFQDPFVVFLEKSKKEVIGHEHSPFHMMEQSIDQVCIMDVIPPMSKLPKYD